MAATGEGCPDLRSGDVELALGKNHGRSSPCSPPVRYRNVERDPNVTLTTRDEENPCRYPEARGEVV